MKHALRSLAQSPGFTLAAVLTLALGIGANTALFTVVDAVLLHPFPYPDADRLVLVGSSGDGGARAPITYPDFLDWRRDSTRFEQLAWARERPVNLTGTAEPARILAAEVSADAFPLLGLPPALGRWLTADDDRPAAAPVAVLSHGAWLNRFHADPAILRKTVTLDGRVYAIAGIMPPRFRFWGAEVWIPAGLFADSEMMRSRTLRMNGFAVGRLRPGIDLAVAHTELELIARRIAAENPSAGDPRAVRLDPFAATRNGGIRPVLLVLLAAVGCVLLIACANVANLLLARNLGRAREFAVRTALGASRAHLVRQLLLETVPLAVLGGAGGLLLAAWTLQLLVALLPASAIPAEADVSLDGRVLAFTVAVALGATLLAGLWPALQLTRVGAADALKSGSHTATAGRRGLRTRSFLVALEVALAVVLLVGAGLLLRSLHKLQQIDPGFQAEHSLALTLQLPDAHYPHAPAAAAFFDRAIADLRTLPGVRAAGGAFALPLSGNAADFPVLIEGRTYGADEEVESVAFNLVLGDYFAAQGIRLRSGRPLGDADSAGAPPAVVINAAFARQFFPDRDPLGRRVRLGIPDAQMKPGLLPPGFDQFKWATVVGIVDDVRQAALAEAPRPVIYLPASQVPDIPILHNNATLLLRTTGDPLTVAAAARNALRQLDRDLPISRLDRMETLVADTLRQPRFSTSLLTTFAALAAGLASLGIAAIVAWSVRQRERELGVRAALGAQRGDLLALVLRQGARPVVLGLVAGLAAAAALTRLLASQLHEISPLDPLSFGAVAFGLLVIAAVASLLPARRATKADPLVALRSE